MNGERRCFSDIRGQLGREREPGGPGLDSPCLHPGHGPFRWPGRASDLPLLRKSAEREARGLHCEETGVRSLAKRPAPNIGDAGEDDSERREHAGLDVDDIARQYLSRGAVLMTGALLCDFVLGRAVRSAICECVHATG